MSFPPSPCPAWCRHAHAEPDRAHFRDLGAVGVGISFVVSAVLVGDAEAHFVRLFFNDDNGAQRFYDFAEDMAADLGHALAVLDEGDVRELGAMLTAGARLLMTEEGGTW